MALSRSTSELDELRAALKKEVTQQTAKWLIAATLGLMAIAVSGWWLYLKPKLVEITGGVPSGVVSAFDSPRDCPPGWGPFDEAAGRVVVGSGEGSGLTARHYREVGGEERHLITLEEMPEHTHEVVEMIPDNNIDGVDSTTTQSGEHHNEKRQSGPAGGGHPPLDNRQNLNNNMPPFIVLTLCRKQ